MSLSLFTDGCPNFICPQLHLTAPAFALLFLIDDNITFWYLPILKGFLVPLSPPAHLSFVNLYEKGLNVIFQPSIVAFFWKLFLKNVVRRPSNKNISLGIYSIRGRESIDLSRFIEKDLKRIYVFLIWFIIMYYFQLLNYFHSYHTNKFVFVCLL